MPSFLDDIKTAITAGFKGKLRTGSLWRTSRFGAHDELGDPDEHRAEYSFEGIVENYSAFYRAQAGIPDTDVRVLIIAGLLAVRPVKDDQVYIEGRWYQVRTMPTVDPANATYTLQCFEIADPLEA